MSRPEEQGRSCPPPINKRPSALWATHRTDTSPAPLQRMPVQRHTSAAPSGVQPETLLAARNCAQLVMASRCARRAATAWAHGCMGAWQDRAWDVKLNLTTCNSCAAAVVATRACTRPAPRPPWRLLRMHAAAVVHTAYHHARAPARMPRQQGSTNRPGQPGCA